MIDENKLEEIRERIAGASDKEKYSSQSIVDVAALLKMIDDARISPLHIDGCPAKPKSKERNAADILAAAADTFRERRAIYGDNYIKVGAMFAVLYPDGLTLRTADDFSRFELFMFVIVKLSRFSNSQMTHVDSIHDACVYAAMLEVLTTARPVGEKA